jgi:membrane-bound serine protease (ClpP class)
MLLAPRVLVLGQAHPEAGNRGQLVLGLAPPARGQTPPAPTLDVIEVTGVIDPTLADYLTGRIHAAQSDGAVAAVIRLDTPGGLDVSMRRIIRTIVNARLPVIVWVAPRGARAASAGTFITYAAHLAYMAESTELGAATPVNLGGGETPPALERTR